MWDKQEINLGTVKNNSNSYVHFKYSGPGRGTPKITKTCGCTKAKFKNGMVYATIKTTLGRGKDYKKATIRIHVKFEKLAEETLEVKYEIRR